MIAHLIVAIMVDDVLWQHMVVVGDEVLKAQLSLMPPAPGANCAALPAGRKMIVMNGVMIEVM